MSLLRVFIAKSMMDPFRSARILEQHYANMLARTLTPDSIFYKPWWSSSTTTMNQNSGSTIVAGQDKFEMNLDVQEFKPEEISIKVTGDKHITIEGKHEEKQDGRGFISRHFVRRFAIPDNYDIKKVVSNLSSDGVLTITAPNTTPEFIEQKEIPINQTGKPAVEQSKEQKE